VPISSVAGDPRYRLFHRWGTVPSGPAGTSTGRARDCSDILYRGRRPESKLRLRDRELSQSVWTDLGRAQYETKRYPEARRSLEKALSLNREDSMAMLYLGLTLIRTGDLSTGERYIGEGTKGLYDWIEYTNRTRPYEDFWDPTRQIRKQIDRLQASISSRDPDPEQIVSAADWIGKKFEEELDRVRRDQSRELDRDGDDGDGHR
jgi:tetratricopeptide (TPR) repeat protein